jgi:hypothetical protein
MPHAQMGHAFEGARETMQGWKRLTASEPVHHARPVQSHQLLPVEPAASRAHLVRRAVCRNKRRG